MQAKNRLHPGGTSNVCRAEGRMEGKEDWVGGKVNGKNEQEDNEEGKEKEGRMEGERDGRREDRKKGRMERKMEGKLEERVGGRRRESGKEGQGWDAGQVLPLAFRVFHVYPRSLSISGISLGALRAPQHLVPGLLMHLHKAVCDPLPMPFASQVSAHHVLPRSATDPGKSAPGRLHFVAQD